MAYKALDLSGKVAVVAGGTSGIGRAIALGNENHLCFENDPNWASLRSDEQFQNMLAKVRASHVAQGIKGPPAG